MFVSKEGWKITLVRISATLTYIPIFLKKVIWANADLIRRILSLKIPLNPAILKIPTKVKSDLGITSLSNSITLTPGTLTVDAEEGYLYVHWIDAKTLEPKKAEKAIKGAFELSLKEVFK
jgi:multicomponent Na+:H+ antiporter subunit E